MQIIIEKIQIEAGLVEVTATAPDDVNVLNLGELAEKAWRAPNKQVEVDGIKVKVRAFFR